MKNKYEISIDFYKKYNDNKNYYNSKRIEVFAKLKEITSVEMRKNLNTEDEKIDRNLEPYLQPVINSWGTYIVKDLNEEVRNLLESFSDYKDIKITDKNI